MPKRFIQSIQTIGRCLKKAFHDWNSRMPFAGSAVLAYYAIFSLPGLLVIIINVSGYFFGKQAVTRQITEQVQGVTGSDTAAFIQNVIANAGDTGGSLFSSILGIATLLFGATGVFYHVQQIFNKIWEVKLKPKPKQKIIRVLKDRLFSFGLILVIGFLLLVSLVISAGLSAISGWVAKHLSPEVLVVFRLLDLVVSVGIITFLFAAMYRYLPDAEVTWKDVWPGALITTVLFVIAKYLLGLYFGRSDPASTYGAAGSVILIMLWVSYSGLILLYGAEFTRVYANRSGRRKVKPSEIAETAGNESGSGFGSKGKKEKNKVH